MLESIMGKGTNRKGKLTHKPARPGDRESTERASNTSREAMYIGGEEYKRHGKTRSAKPSNQDATGGCGQCSFWVVAVRETDCSRAKE